MNDVARQQLLAIFRAGLAAVDPGEAVRRHVSLRGTLLQIGPTGYDLADTRRVIVVGAGKAVAHMAEVLEDMLGPRLTTGWINVKTGHGLPLKTVHVHEAGHPIPDKAGVHGTREILRLVHDADANDLVICCLTGGGSALLPLPADGVSLEDKQTVTQELLACGADIREVNAVRKHLSQVKGGRLARLAHPARIATLILSDVIGDPLDVIASGPTAADASTFAEAVTVLERHGIAEGAPASVQERLHRGARGEFPETPKPGDEIFGGVNNVIVGNNRAAVEACSRKAATLGYCPLILSTSIEGEAREVARTIVAVAREALAYGRPVAAPACLISGGETTVTLRGDGLGGRNQEFALAAALAADGLRSLTLLAAGTDGTDGPTDAAGAFADGDTSGRAERMGLSASEYLAANDSYHFFERLGDLLKTGPTGTNVMDLYLLLLETLPPSGAKP